MKYRKLFDNYVKTVSKSKILNFFFKNQTRYLILLLALNDFTGEKKIIKNFKYYYTNIPTFVSSQININIQIDLAIEAEYLIKKKSIYDKRSTIITVSEEVKKEFDKNFKDITNFSI